MRSTRHLFWGPVIGLFVLTACNDPFGFDNSKQTPSPGVTGQPQEPTPPATSPPTQPPPVVPPGVTPPPGNPPPVVTPPGNPPPGNPPAGGK